MFFLFDLYENTLKTTLEDTHTRKNSNKIWFFARLFVSLPTKRTDYEQTATTDGCITHA